MPFSPAMKKWWRQENRDKQKIYQETWRLKNGYYERLEENRKKKESEKLIKEKEKARKSRLNELKAVEREQRKNRKSKDCSRCKEHKPIDQYPTDKRKIDNKREFCRECDNLRNRLARQHDPDSKWKRRLQGIRQRERRLGLNATELSYIDIQSIFIKFNNTCFACDSTNQDELTIDHHIPMNNGCNLTMQNAVVLCKSCNSRKTHMHPKEFYTQQQINKLYIYYGIDT